MTAASNATYWFMKKRFLALSCLVILLLLLVVRLNMDPSRPSDSRVPPGIGLSQGGRYGSNQYSADRGAGVKQAPHPANREVSESVSDDGRELCTLEKITEYVASHDFFPDEGYWRGKNKPVPHFVPRLCQFAGVNPNKANMRACLKEKKISSILFIGDSNGHRYYLGARRLFERLYGKDSCKLVKQDQSKSWYADPTYFTKGTNIGLKPSDINIKRWGCAACKNSLLNCTDSRSTTMVELLVMDHYNDREVTVNREKCSQGQRCEGGDTHQEFVFNKYVTSTAGYSPDVIMFFANTHDVHAYTNSTQRRDDYFEAMRKIFRLVKKNIPSTTRVIWFSVHGSYANNDFFRWDERRLFNEYMFKILKPQVTKRGSNVYTFLDLQTMSRDLLPLGWMPITHMKDEWYGMLMSYIMQTVCNSQWT